jgi:hypothetical protein
VKVNVQPFTDGWNVVEKIRPVVYKWNGLWGQTNDDRDVVGVIGQDLEAIAPYAVMRTLDRLYKNGEVTEILEIDTTSLIILLVNTYLDLRERVRKVEKERGIL